jgi:hypothetical protein
MTPVERELLSYVVTDALEDIRPILVIAASRSSFTDEIRLTRLRDVERALAYVKNVSPRDFDISVLQPQREMVIEALEARVLSLQSDIASAGQALLELSMMGPPREP